MCDAHTLAARALRYGSRLEHGPAHTEEHRRWSRRDFLTGLGLAAAGGTLMLGGTPVKTFARSPLLSELRRLETDRVLVLIQLSGGNDGLNTIIPFNDDLYYNARPGIAIPKADVLPLSGDLGMHPSFEALVPLFGEGHMAVLQNVGYPDPVLSHFRSTDIWASASDSDVVETTGWAGRYLDAAFPNFEEAPPEYPLAVQIGGGSPLLFQGPSANMGMSLLSVELFERIAETGLLYDAGDVPTTTYGTEMAFVRTVANDSFKYASIIQEAANKAGNTVEYPSNNPLAGSLAVTAQLIKGGLGARIYTASLGSFDTHANQLATQGTLLRNLAEAVEAFYADLAADGLTDRVLIMTFSEFGRRISQNGSGGTDHGTAAPMLLFGDGLTGGLYGNAPNLSEPDETGNIRYEIDFRSAYATVLQDWFGMAPDTVAEVLGQPFETVPFVRSPLVTGTAPEPEPLPQTITLDQNYPNPFNPRTTISFTLARTAPVRLQVFDVQGRLVRTLADGLRPAGTYTLSFDAEGLPSGTYFYRLETMDGVRTRTMVLVR
ncbi:DUF1501 domain-containing protein [Rhodocaloribacter sp.]